MHIAANHQPETGIPRRLADKPRILRPMPTIKAASTIANASHPRVRQPMADRGVTDRATTASGANNGRMMC